MRFWVPDAAGQGWSRHVRQVYRQTEGNKGAAAAGGREHGGRGGRPPLADGPRGGARDSVGAQKVGATEVTSLTHAMLGTARAATRESTSPRSTGRRGRTGSGSGSGSD